MKHFTKTKEAIIRYLIAENEEIEEPNPLGPYLRAFSGAFLPNMPFTLCRSGTTNLSLYVQDDTDEPVSLRCIALKQKLLEIRILSASSSRMDMYKPYPSTVMKTQDRNKGLSHSPVRCFLYPG